MLATIELFAVDGSEERDITILPAYSSPQFAYNFVVSRLANNQNAICRTSEAPLPFARAPGHAIIIRVCSCPGDLMKLDTRRPILVLLGAWNPAIFRPEWVAAQLLGVPEGQQITVRALLEVKEQKQLFYIGDLGYYVNQQRFEIYSQRYDDADLRSVAHFVAKICEILPHTPLGNFGINFRFFEGDPPDRLYEMISTNEQLDERYRIISQQVMTKFAHSQDVELNLKRITSEQEITFDFNYHHLVVDKRALTKITPEYVRSLLDESFKLMEMTYGLTEYDYAAHDFEGIPEGEEEADVPSA